MCETQGEADTERVPLGLEAREGVEAVLGVMVVVRDGERVPEPQGVLLGVLLRVGLWEAVRERLSVPVPQGERVVLGGKEGEAGAEEQGREEGSNSAVWSHRPCSSTRQ